MKICGLIFKIKAFSLHVNYEMKRKSILDVVVEQKVTEYVEQDFSWWLAT